MLNNPLKYVDPSGHMVSECGPSDCAGADTHHMTGGRNKGARSVAGCCRRETATFDPYSNVGVIIDSPTWQIIHYSQGTPFSGYMQSDVPGLPPARVELPLVNPVVPAVAGSELSMYYVEDSSGFYMETSARGFVGVGGPGTSIGIESTVTGSGNTDVGFYGEFGGEFGIGVTGDGIGIRNPGGEFGVKWNGNVETYYVLTTDYAVEASGGYNGFGRQYVFGPGADFSYGVYDWGASSRDEAVIVWFFRWQMPGPLWELP